MLNKQLLNILACPLCKGVLLYRESEKELICLFDQLAYPIKDGIPLMLEDKARLVSSEEKEALKKL